MNGAGEMLLLLGSLVIFSLTSLNINSMLGQNTQIMTTQEYEYEAIALGQSYIDALRILTFDESTLGGTVPANIPNDFSNASNFGGNGEGESISEFDDFDDFDGYSITDSTVHGVYTIEIVVYYVDSGDLDTNAGTKTIHKRMDVTVSNPFLENDITLSYIRSYTGNL